MAREVFKIVDLVVTFQEEPNLDVYLVFELQDAKIKTSVRHCTQPSLFEQAARNPTWTPLGWSRERVPPSSAMHTACRCSRTRDRKPVCASAKI